MEVSQPVPGKDGAIQRGIIPPSGSITYVLRLYVAGNTHKSNQAVLILRHLCDKHLPGRYQLDVVDIYQNPSATREDQIIATPTLVKSEPQPLRKFIGDLSKVDRLLDGLGLMTSKSG